MTADGDDTGLCRTLLDHLMCELDVLGAADGGRAHGLEGIGGLGHGDGTDDGESGEKKECRL